MKAPHIIQFIHGDNTQIRVGPWWKFKLVWKSVFRWNGGEVREFSDTANEQLIKHFTNHPPRVGDLIYIEGCFKIIKVVYNFNHDKYFIWWYHALNEDMNDVTIIGA